jgi:hypothetical protein
LHTERACEAHANNHASFSLTATRIPSAAAILTNVSSEKREMRPRTLSAESLSVGPSSYPVRCPGLSGVIPSVFASRLGGE